MVQTLNSLIECYNSQANQQSKRDVLKELIQIHRENNTDQESKEPDTTLMAYLIHLYTTLFQTADKEECVEVYYQAK